MKHIILPVIIFFSIGLHPAEEVISKHQKLNKAIMASTILTLRPLRKTIRTY